MAKRRIGASYQMGGLKMDFSKEVAQGLMLNSIDRLRRQVELRGEQQNFLYQLMVERLREINGLNIKELQWAQ